MDEKPKRRWFRFSLQTMLVAVTLAACALGWLAWQVQIVRERKMILQAIKASTDAGESLWTTKLDAYKNNPAASTLDYLQVSNVRRWLGDEAYVQISFVGALEPSLVERMEAAFPESQLHVASAAISDDAAFRDSLYAPANRRSANTGNLFKTGLIEK